MNNKQKQQTKLLNRCLTKRAFFSPKKAKQKAKPLIINQLKELNCLTIA